MLTAVEAPLRQSRAPERKSSHQNVGMIERVATVGGGGWLVLRALKHRNWAGLAGAGIGVLLLRRGVSGHCDLYEKLGVDTNGHKTGPQRFFNRGIHVAQAYTINKPAHELFAFWRNFENLPQFMSHLEAVKVVDEKLSRWKAKAPAGSSVEWDAQIINEQPDKLIAWRSLDGADVEHAGSVRFIPTKERGTVVRVVLDYIPPMGPLGAMVARLFGKDPEQQIKEDLRHFKQLMETGEIPTSQGPRGACGHASRHGGNKS